MSNQNQSQTSGSSSRLRAMVPSSLPVGKKSAAAFAGVAAAAGVAYAAYRKFGTNGFRFGSSNGDGTTTYHVRPTDDGWEVTRDGASQPEETFPTKAEAVDAGRRMARRNEPSELYVYRIDGTVSRQHSYGEETN